MDYKKFRPRYLKAFVLAYEVINKASDNTFVWP